MAVGGDQYTWSFRSPGTTVTPVGGPGTCSWAVVVAAHAGAPLSRASDVPLVESARSA
jgi:hypothetical protein